MVRFRTTGVVRDTGSTSSTEKDIPAQSLPSVVTSDPYSGNISSSGSSGSSGGRSGGSGRGGGANNPSYFSPSVIVEQQSYQSNLQNQRRLDEIRRNIESQRRNYLKLQRLRMNLRRRKKQNMNFIRGRSPAEIVDEIKRLERRQKMLFKYSPLRKKRIPIRLFGFSKTFSKTKKRYYTIKPIRKRKISAKQRRALLKNLRKARRVLRRKRR
jgi:hypothetical protein